MSQTLLTKKSGWRGSREAWTDAAYEALLDLGVDAVKVMPLAEKLGLSRTSFYGHFSDREDLLQDLIELWRHKNTDNLVRQSEAYAETIAEAILNVFDCWLDPALFDSRLEFAMRNWAHADPELGAILAQTDRVRLAALRAMFERFDIDTDFADIRASAMYQTQIGYISMRTEEPIPDRIRRMPAYAETFAGRAPSEGEVARFMARHADQLDAAQS